VNREIPLEKCTPILRKENAKDNEQLKTLLAPAVKEIAIGVGERAVKIGGKLVMYRHEFAYANPTAIAIDVTDDTSEEELLSRIRKTSQFSFEYIGQPLRLDLIAVRCTTNDKDKYAVTVRKVAANTCLPLILCSLNPSVLEAGLKVVPESRPLLYAATKNNWKDMTELAKTYNCPLTVSAPGNLRLLRSLSKTLLAYGVNQLVLDPGTFLDGGLSDTLNGFTLLRRAACMLSLPKSL
jgi:acetyl-CoA decarbonylase/synthase complex subunit gamma